jgi:hypothetical protein
MSFSFKKSSFAAGGLQAGPGDVFAWSCPPPIGKRKYHLCVSYDYDFVFLNSPKDRHYPTDFRIRAADLMFLKPTRQAFSAVSCVDIQTVGSQRSFQARKPQHLGNLGTNVLLELLEHMCLLETFTLEDVDRLKEVIDAMRSYTSPPEGPGSK